MLLIVAGCSANALDRAQASGEMQAIRKHSGVLKPTMLACEPSHFGANRAID
jgi:hypothetical protein